MDGFVDLSSVRVVEEKPKAPDGANALELLQAVYRDKLVPLPVRIRCAVECLPFENPKLSAVAVASLSGNDFASALDKAIARSGVKLIEAKAGPQPEQLSPCAGVAAPCTHSSLSYCRTREFRGS